MSNAVPVHINSGNPAYPFPQFLEYAYGDSHRLGNLGTKNAEGVVHAEMERDIREAYQIHANEFEYVGEWNGIKLIWTPVGNGRPYDCTEGDGYGLLACAYMADQVTFNGYWIYTHDQKRSRTKTYMGCKDNAPNYGYGPFALGDGGGAGGNTAADGDVDVALALYVAYKQWGEFMKDEQGNVVKDDCGNPISYKEAMIEVLRGLVALSTCRTTDIQNGVSLRVNSGMIGMDGYPKGGDTWCEQTNWATSHPYVFDESKEIYNLPGDENSKIDVKGLQLVPEFGSATTQHIDYNAPSYFREFYELFEELGGDPWEIEQFRRGEASSDWLIGQLIGKSQYSIPTAGWVSVFQSGERVQYWTYEFDKDGNKTDSTFIDRIATEPGTEFSNFDLGEDYRCSWRTICNYMWHGNPSYSWDPENHKVVEGGNTYEYDAAVRFSKWMNDPSNWNPAAGSHCIDYGTIHDMPYSGPATIRWQNDPNTGVGLQDFFCSLSLQSGMGTYAAVGAQDFELMGMLYRECNIKWYPGGDAKDIDVPVGEECNVGKKGNYMHGWARQMGMMVASGNYPAPSSIEPKPNMKIYRAIKDSVTFCFTGDQITYLLDYRNYGSVDAKDVVIVENVPSDFDVVSVSDGGVYNSASHTITWNIGAVSGYHSDGTESGHLLDLSKANLKATMGQVSYVARVGKNASGRYCTTADISCSNGLGWTTNEYPNYQTATMQRNCVDVLKRSLEITKSVDREKINPGQIATFSIHINNSSEVGWIDGGRPRVTSSWAFETSGVTQRWKMRMFNDAIEPLVNLGNYRISYYTFDSSVDDLCGQDNCSDGVWMASKNAGGRFDKLLTVTHENIVEGEDPDGKKWNQRIMIQFPNVYTTTSMNVSWSGSEDASQTSGGGANCAIHRGSSSSMMAKLDVNTGYTKAHKWTDDWSYGNYEDNSNEGLFLPISPAWQRLDDDGVTIEEPINKWITCGCTTSDKVVNNVLVEEYDGYVWRRVLGNGPMAGRDIDSVYVRDTLPLGMEFVSFVGDCPLQENGATWKNSKTSDGRDVIVWFIPKMQVKHQGTIKYNAIVTFPSGADCPSDDETIINHAWIEGVNNSPIEDTTQITVTCGKVVDPIVPTTLVKKADKENYEVGDDIEYSIKYEQTHGAVFEDAGSVTSNWSLSGGATISSGTLSVNQRQSAEFQKIAKNIYLETQMTVPSDQSGYISFRDDIKLVFLNMWSGLAVSCYDGNVRVDSVVLKKADGPTKLCVDLRDDVLRVWTNRDTSRSASATFEVRTLKDGHVEFGVTGSGIYTYSNIHIHTDYAYDLSIVDLVPAEVEVDESSFQSFHNGSAAGSGKLLKGTDGDSIVWTGLADNPIAFGDTFTVTWKGKVVECSEKIINQAKAKLLGHAHNEIMAQAVSGCGEEYECPLPDVVLKLSADTICSGETVKLTVSPTGFKYIFLEGGQVISDTLSENTFEDTPISGGVHEYSVMVVSPKSKDSLCYSPSEVMPLFVAPLPYIELKSLGTFCAGNADLTDFETKLSDLESAGTKVYWKDDLGDPITSLEINKLTEPKNYKYSCSLISKEGCESEYDYDLKFTLKKIDAPVVNGSYAYLLSDTSASGVFEKNLIQQDNSVVKMESGYSYLWYDENFQLLTDVPVPDAKPTNSLVYYVNRTQSNGCVSDTVPVSVTVTGSDVPTPINVTYCLNVTAEPIRAEINVDENSSATSWELVYYDASGNELKTEAERTPNTSIAGDTLYYVSQREVGNPANESAKVPLKVSVIELIPDVSMNRTQYCWREEYEELQVKGSSLLPTTFSWSLDGKSVTGVPLAQTQVETITYGVVESYQIDADHKCESDTVKLVVKSTFVPEPTGTRAVNYLKGEADATGLFPSILKKDPSAVTTMDSEDYELVWYADKSLSDELTDDELSPKVDPNWKSDNDSVIVYYVRQRHKESGCMSDTVPVVVTISNSLIPNAFPMNYCHMSKAVSLDNSTSINTNNGKEKESDYELVWYSPVDNYSQPLSEAPVPSTDVVGVTIYKVAQKRKADGTIGSKADVKVEVYANPEITMDALPQSCDEEVDLTKYVHLKNTVDTSTLSFYYFSDRNCTNPVNDMKVKESTVLYANAYYTIFSQPNIVGTCSSDTMEINVSIDKLQDLKVDAPNSVCPNGDIQLTASALSSTTTPTFEWSGDATGSDAVLSTKDESGVFGTEYSYKVTAKAGACTLDTTVKVLVGRGELTGTMFVNGDENRSFDICGGESLTLSTTHDGTDFSWTDLSGNAIGTGKSITVTPEVSTTYVLSFVNKCETSDTIVVTAHPLTLTADFTLLDVTICENSAASAKLTLSGYEPTMTGSYIKWFKDGNELSEFVGSTELSLSSVVADNSGEYTYEVSNGICLAKTNDAKTSATLLVKPFVGFSAPSDVETPYGESPSLEISNVVPSSANVAWSGDVYSGEGNPFLAENMTKDELFEVKLSADGYCDTTTTLQVLVDAKVRVAITSSADTICSGESVTLTADTTGTGRLLHPDAYKLTWYAIPSESSDSTKLSAPGIETTENPEASVSYVAVVEYGAQREVSDHADVMVYTPAAYTKSENLVSCEGEEVTAEVSCEDADASVRWSDQGVAAPTITVAPEKTTSYPFTVSVNGYCPVSDEVVVRVQQLPEVTLEAEARVCEGNSIELKPVIGEGDYDKLSWTDPDGEEISTEKNLIITPEKSGEYTITIINDLCGNASYHSNVKVVPTPEIYVDSITFASRQLEVASGGYGAFEYKVDQREWQSENLFENLSFNVMHTGYVRDELGCMGIVAFFVPKPPVPIPEYFVPGEGSAHDVWDLAPIFEAYPKSTVKIFDRTGKVVAELEGDTQDWDGTYNGNALPSTDYWYIINVPEIRQQFTGHFTLIRSR